MASLAEIEELAKTYAAARDDLADAVRETEEEMARIKRRRVPVIRRRADAAANAKAHLEAAVGKSPELFKSPRTLTLHGIKVGYQKAKGKVKIADEQRVVALIRKRFPDRFDDLVKTEEKPIKKALNNLTSAELKKIGCTVTDSGDEVVIKATDSEIDKLVDALLKEADDQDKGAAASGQAA